MFPRKVLEEVPAVEEAAKSLVTFIIVWNIRATEGEIVLSFRAVMQLCDTDGMR